MDGTEYFSSYACSCQKCLTTKPGKKTSARLADNSIYHEALDETPRGVRYAHKVVQIAIMHPDIRQVIPFMPEPISNTDGATKQACEVNAAKRLIPSLRKAPPHLGIILGGDDLFSRQPMITEVLAARMHYLFVAKPQTHTYLMDWLGAYPALHAFERLEIKQKETIRHVDRWMNDVPLNGSDQSILVNYLYYAQDRQKENNNELLSYQNSWVTDIELTQDTIKPLAKGGRCRWKIEHECFNTLKNQGYCIKHSYGHGQTN